MADKQYKAPEVTENMKVQYLIDAERQYRNMSSENMQKEYKKLIRGKTPWEWVKDKVGSFVNMVKIAALSLFLGRQETARRVNAGNREADFEKLKNEAKKEAKIHVLEKKLEELQNDSKDKEAEQPEVKPEQEPAHEEKQDISKNKQDKEEQAQEQEEIKEPKKAGQTIFAEQVERLSEEYQNGLKKFLEMQTGIAADFIKIENSRDEHGPRMKVSFDLDLPEGSQYTNSISIDQLGNSMEHTVIADALAKSVLFYTADVYRESKNNTRIIGTVPSVEMCSNAAFNFCRNAKEQEKNGKENYKHTEYLFSHKIDFIKTGDKFRVFFDEKELDFKDGWSAKGLSDEVRKMMTDKENGDYTLVKQSELSKILHDVTKSEIEPSFYAKYSGQNLEEHFTKYLTDITKDNGDIIRDSEFHGHLISVNLNPENKTIETVMVDNVPVYQAIDGIQDNDKIAEHIADSLGESLDKEGMYLSDGIMEKIEDSISFSNDDIQAREDVSTFEQALEYDDQEEELS